MKKTSAVVVVALFAAALGCKKKPADSGGTKPAASDGGAAVIDGGAAAPDAAAAAEAPTLVPVRELVIGADAGLPDGQLAQIGGLKFAHAFEMITQLELTADGPISASASFVRAWDAAGHLRWQSWTYGRVSRFALSPDGKQVAVVHSTPIGGRLTLLDRAGKAGAGSETERIEQLAWSADGKRLVLAGPTVAIHDGATAARVATAKHLATAAGFAADGSVIFVGKDGVWSWTGAADAEPVSVSAFTAPPTAAALAPDAATVWWSDGKAVSALDVKTKAITAVAVSAGGTITALRPRADGKALAVMWKGGVRIFDLGATPSQRWERLNKAGATPAIGFGPDGKQIAVSEVGVVTLSDAATGGWSKPTDAPTFKGFTPSSFAVIAAADGTKAYDISNGIGAPATEDRPADAPGWIGEYVYDGKGTAIGWASGSTDACGTLKLWVSGGAGEVTLPKPPKCPADDLGTWQIGPSLVTNVAGQIIEPESKKVIFTVPLGGRPLISLSTSSDRSHAVAVLGPVADSTDESETGTLITEYQLPDGAVIKEYKLERGAGDGGDAVSGAIAVNDGTMYVGTKDGAVYIVQRGGDLPAPAVTMNAPVLHLEQSPSGGNVAITDGDDRTIIFGLR